MDLREVMILASGLDDNKKPKCSVVLMNDFINQDGEIVEHVDELTIETAEVQFFASYGFVAIDLDFGSKYNTELGMAMELLNSFRVAKNSIDVEGDRIPVTSVNIMLEDSDDGHAIFCHNPLIYALTPYKVDKDATIIRMTFFEDNCILGESDEISNETTEEAGEYVFDIDRE